MFIDYVQCVLVVIPDNNVGSNGLSYFILSYYYARYSGRPVCRGTHPVGREEGILVVEWSLTGTATYCFGPEFSLRLLVRKARSDQSALVMPWRLYFSHLLAYCIVSILNSILWTLYSVVYDSNVIAHGSIWREVLCIPDHPVHVG